jgi:hypothetical protein
VCERESLSFEEVGDLSRKVTVNKFQLATQFEFSKFLPAGQKKSPSFFLLPA